MADKPKQILELEEYWGIEIGEHEYKIENRNITSLILREKGIKDIAPLERLKNLTVLDLSLNDLTHVMELKGLTNLIELYLWETNLTDITALSGLTNLSILNLNHLHNNKLSDLAALSELTKLTKLYLGGNQLTNLTVLKRLSNLNELYLSRNRLTDVRALGGLTKLERLFLTANKLTDITALRGLSNLLSLYLSDNKLTDINSLNLLLNLEQLQNVYLDNNPITSQLPQEELKQGWTTLKKYLQSKLAHSLADINEVKVLFLGNTNIGKSTLLEYLETGKVKTVDATFGIQYKRLTKFMPDINIHVWDFGGQDYFHATHKLFFSPGALHILMWSQNHEARDGEKGNQNYPLEYWLRCSEQLCQNEDYSVNILITENRMDGGSPQLKEQVSIGNQYSNLNLQFTAINLKPKRRLEGFKELLKELIENLPILKQPRPLHYKTYLDKINNAKLEGKKFLSTGDFNPKNEEEEKQISTTMEVFHLMGLLLYFPSIIRGKIFIEPKVLLDLLYESILNKRAEEKKGKIEESDFEEALMSHPLKLKKDEVIKLLQYFDLIFQIPNEAHWFAPQYLPEREQAWLDFISKYLFTFPNVRIDSDSYLMNVALLKLFAEYGKMVKRQPIKHSNDVEYLFWRDGLVIEKDGQVLMVKFDRAQQALLLYGDKEGKNLTLQKEVINFIVGLAEEDRRDMRYPEKAFLEKERTIEEIWNTNKFTVNLGAKEGEYVPWRLLNQSKTSTVQHEGKTFLLKDFLQFLPRNKMPMKKIFISYSKADLVLVNLFIDHLAALQVNGEVESWYCTELKAGEKWEETIQSHFDSADIICFMISPNFMKTKYIHQYEIPRAFDRAKNPNPPAIVPIVLDFCDWKTTENNLQAFNALPYTLKPIADFANQNMAWYIVVEMLKQIITNPTVKTHEELLGKIPTDVKKIYERIVLGKVDAGG